MAISFVQVSCSVFGIRSEENPKYQVLSQSDDKEIRSYSPYVIAKTVVKGDFKEAQGHAFRILAGYIFGDNAKKQSISMTAPVLQSKPSESEKISMTAPVVQTQSGDGWQMSFMMPSKYKISDLPAPNDNRVHFEEVPAKIVGVIRYSGRGLPSTNAEKAEDLKNWIVTDGKYEIVSSVSYAGYDPPWTIPIFRKNEMMYELKASGHPVEADTK